MATSDERLVRALDKGGLRNQSIGSYENIISPPETKLKGYCLSAECCTGFKRKEIEATNNSMWACPECGDAIYWQRVKV